MGLGLVVEKSKYESMNEISNAKGRLVDALALMAKKDVTACEKLRGAGKKC